jgi:DNA-binding IclR family transcriptional regulator
VGAAALAEREELARRGYAVNRDAWIDGLSVLGVPIWQRSQPGGTRLAAVLALAAASTRFEAIGEARIATRLVTAAATVGERLGVAIGAIPRGRETRGTTPATAPGTTPGTGE